MRIYHFSEQPCPDAWAPEHKSLRVVLPSRNCDPRVMTENYHHRLDEWMLADELGLDIMINEHHATATCCCPWPRCRSRSSRGRRSARGSSRSAIRSRTAS